MKLFESLDVDAISFDEGVYCFIQRTDNLNVKTL